VPLTFATLTVRDSNVISLVLSNLVSGMFVTVIEWWTLGSRDTTENRTMGAAWFSFVRPGWFPSTMDHSPLVSSTESQSMQTSYVAPPDLGTAM